MITGLELTVVQLSAVSVYTGGILTYGTKIDANELGIWTWVGHVLIYSQLASCTVRFLRSL